MSGKCLSKLDGDLLHSHFGIQPKQREMCTSTMLLTPLIHFITETSSTTRLLQTFSLFPYLQAFLISSASQKAPALSSKRIPSQTFCKLFVNQHRFPPQIYHTTKLFMLSPFFSIVEIQIVIHSPPSLEFSHSKNMPRHFIQELKTPAKKPTKRYTPPPTQWSNTSLYHLCTLTPSAQQKTANSFAPTRAQTQIHEVRFPCFTKSRSTAVAIILGFLSVYRKISDEF